MSRVDKAFPAAITLMSLLSRMNSFMFLQLTSLSKVSVADGASVRFFTCVDSQMNHKRMRMSVEENNKKI